MRIRWKLPIAFALTTLAFAGIVAVVAAVVLRGVYLDRLQDDMSLQARQFAAVLDQLTTLPNPPENAQLQELVQEAGTAGNLRLTLITHDGQVLADSAVDPSTLDNHAHRPEVAQALAGSEGRARRLSTTLGVQEVYVAIPLPPSDTLWSRGVVRAALPASRIDALLAASWRVPLIVWAILLLPTLAAGYLVTRSLVRPLEKLRHMAAQVAAGNLSFRNAIHRNDELGELADSLNIMAAELEARVGQLKVEEERSGQVLGAMEEGVLVLDQAGRLLRANPAAGRILDIDISKFQGKPFVLAARFFPHQSLMQKAAAAGEPLTDVVEMPGGRYVVVEVIPLRPTTGEERHTLFVIRDETTRLATERMRRDFATNVSHELKTPLAGLSLLATTLKHTVRHDPDQAEYFVDRLAAEIARLNDLTNDLLTLSRLEETEVAAEEVYKQEPVDLAMVAGEVVSEVRAAAEAKGQELIFDSAGPAYVLGDEVLLRTLVRNLVDNAIRYTGEQGHVSVQVLRQTDLGRQSWVVLVVSDDGIGIPRAEQERIFERFYRVDKARSRETGGTGLGLSIVRHVAERHGGTVEVKSTVGVGSTFTVRIPEVQFPPT